MSLLRKAVLVNSTEFICLVVGLAQTIIVTRVLGPAGVGQYAVSISTLMLVGEFASLGLPSSFLYYSKRDPNGMRPYLMNAFWGAVLLGVVSGTVLTAVVRWESGYFGELPWYVMAGFGLYVPLVGASAVCHRSLLVDIEARRLSTMSLGVTLGSTSLVLVLYGLDMLTAGNAILCFVSTAFFRVAIGWYWVRRRVDFSIWPTWKTCRSLAVMGIRLSWVNVMVLVNSQLNIMLVKYLADDFESVGYFSRGQRTAMLLITAAQAVFPLLFSRWASLSGETLARHVELVMRFASAVGFVMIVFILLTGKWVVIILYGREFLPAVGPMVILLPGTVVHLLSRLLSMVLGSQGAPEASALAMLLMAALNAVLTWILIPVLGINGAAVAFSVANLGLLLILINAVRQRYNVQIRNCLVLTRDDLLHAWRSLLGWKKATAG